MKFFAHIIFAFFFVSAAFAQVTTDGSLGKSVDLLGPDYDITANLGKQAGNNLFHSFSQFDINTGENAIFSGPDHIQNVISRVTGRDGSWIDGGLISEITGANLYLMNPSGIHFGPNAHLNIDGAFHATTTNHIPLGKTGKFSAVPGEENLLEHPPPSAFHSAGQGAITLNGSMIVNPKKNITLTGSDVTLSDSLIDTSGNLEVPEENAGNITIQGNTIEIKKSAMFSKSYSKGGNTTITGNGINLSDSLLNVTGFEKTGNISIQGDNVTIGNGSGIYAKSAGTGGKINITANKFEMSGTSHDGYPAEILLTDFAPTPENTPGTLNLAAKNISLKDGAWITSQATGAGKGGNININADSISMQGEFEGIGSGFFSSVYPFGTGDGGDININADKISMIDGAYINSVAYGPGNAGDIKIVTDSLTASGATSQGWASNIAAGSEPEPLEGNLTSGSSGNIDINADKISLSDGGQISSSSIAQPGTSAGNAGQITISANTITATGTNPHGPNEDGYGSGIYARSWGSGATDAGTITIDADDVELSNGGTINTESGDHGGGQITATADKLYLHDGGKITTSVAQGEGMGGDVTLDAGLTILNRGSVTAKAFEGDGGAIFIRTDNYLKSADSTVSASSERGNDGTITIDAPDTDVTKGLNILPSNLLDISDFANNECDKKPGQSYFIIKGYDNTPRIELIKGLR